MGKSRIIVVQPENNWQNPINYVKDHTRMYLIDDYDLGDKRQRVKELGFNMELTKDEVQNLANLIEEGKLKITKIIEYDTNTL